MLEMLIGLLELGGCFLELTAGTIDLFALFSGRRYYGNRRNARRQGEPMPRQAGLSLAFWIALFVGVLLTGLVIWRWTRALAP